MDLAVNLALSVRRLDTRPIALLTNGEAHLSPEYISKFNTILKLPHDASIRGAMNKARLFEFTPYRRTMYVDSDCLLFNPRIEFFWQKFRGQPFAVEGHRQSTGPVFACSLGEKDAAELCRRYNLAFLSVFNAGVMYFEKTDSAGRVFDRVLELYRSAERDTVSYRYKHEGEYADEPFFAVALAELGIAPHESALTHRLQVTTPNAIDGVFDLEVGDLRVVKCPPGGTANVWSGALCHFCGLSPMNVYFDLADKLRQTAGLPLMDRTRFQPVVLSATHHQDAVHR
ncbi:MAG: hypothetical protein SFV19_19975 [Rhodospirillaceae bacterium]|nr:hypothetical protein [Rhodospirillaceae bacterium]